MIDHISVGTNNIARAREFYDSVLGCLGLRGFATGEQLTLPIGHRLGLGGLRRIGIRPL